MPSDNPKARAHLEALHDIPIADRSEYALTIPDMVAFEDGLLEAGCPLDEIDALITELEFYRSTKIDDVAVHLMKILGQSVLAPDENSAVDPLKTIPEVVKPRFPTGVPVLDRMTFGGGYGLTTVAGDAKAGKTMFAIGAAVEAALDGWKVVYINAELDRSEAIMAFMRKCGGQIPSQITERLTLVTPDYTFQPSDAIARIREAVGFGDDRVLTVLDSINALIDLSSDGSGTKVIDYWSALSLWRNFAVRATKLSEGRLAFLVVSETNRQGQVKGGSLEYKSNLVVRIQKDPSDVAMVELDVTLSRSSPSGSLGRFFRNWEKGVFAELDNTYA